MSSDLPQGTPGDPLMQAMRALALESTFFSHAVADRLGMAATDFACLSLLFLEGPASAGRLAERTGLSTGAITGVVDRLERGGWARRVSDPADRRRVIVTACPERRQDINPVMAPMLGAAHVIESHLSESHREAVVSFIVSAGRMLAEQTSVLRHGGHGRPPGPGTRPPGVADVPRGDVTHGDLKLMGLASRLVVSGANLGEALCRVEMTGGTPLVEADGGKVTVHERGRWRWGGSQACQVTLTTAVPWTVEITGGASRVLAELADVEVTALAFSGGASQVILHLPQPRGAVPIKLSGGASKVAVHRPPGVPVSLCVNGGASHVLLDGRRVRSLGDGVRLVTEGSGPGVYDVEIAAGASRVVIDS